MTQEQITRSVDGLKAEATARLTAREARRPARRPARRAVWRGVLMTVLALLAVLAGAEAVLTGQRVAADYRAAVLASVTPIEPAPVTVAAVPVETFAITPRGGDVCHASVEDVIGRVPDALAAACDYRYNDTGARCWEDEVCAVADIRDNGSFPDNVAALNLHPAA